MVLWSCLISIDSFSLNKEHSNNSTKDTTATYKSKDHDKDVFCKYSYKIHQGVPQSVPVLGKFLDVICVQNDKVKKKSC